MPVYRYQCDNCGAQFDVRQGFHDKPVAVCSVCQGLGRRIFCPVPIVFKGSGFYVTDSRSDRSLADDKSSAGVAAETGSDG